MLLKSKQSVPDHYRRAAWLGCAVFVLASFGFSWIGIPGREGVVMLLKWALLTLPVVTMPLLGKVSRVSCRKHLPACPFPIQSIITRADHTTRARPAALPHADQPGGRRTHLRHRAGRRAGLLFRRPGYAVVDPAGAPRHVAPMRQRSACGGVRAGGPLHREPLRSPPLAPVNCCPQQQQQQAPALQATETDDLFMASAGAALAALSVLCGKRWNLDLSARLFVIAFLLVAFSSQQGQGARVGCCRAGWWWRRRRRLARPALPPRPAACPTRLPHPCAHARHPAMHATAADPRQVAITRVGDIATGVATMLLASVLILPKSASVEALRTCVC